VLALKTRSQSGQLVPLSEIVDVEKTQRENAIYHKDLLPVVFVFGDMAGNLDSPLYGMFEIFGTSCAINPSAVANWSSSSSASRTIPTATA
jgi:multidrug efflux pump subunit AcrB